jgi:prolyl oligopeptidase
LFCKTDLIAKQVTIPKVAGTLKLTTYGDYSKKIWIRIKGWTSNLESYRYDFEKELFVEENIYPIKKFKATENTIVEEIEVVSHDGVKVPLSIIYKKGTKLDGKNRLLMTGYGAYGSNDSPFLDIYLLSWIRAGGIYASAHVRGGGEKGDAWYMGGYKKTKPNTWKDFIACSEYLIKNGYTSPEKHAIWSGSAGGILIGRAITERPDLYAAAIIEVGILNTTRVQFGPNGQDNVYEFGNANDSLEFLYLLEMDAYQSIKKNVNYPAIYLTAGMNDNRVQVWQPGKFAAKMQAYNKSDKPILFSVDFEGGHGLQADENKVYKQLADAISFALWQTGHPDYNLKD